MNCHNFKVEFYEEDANFQVEFGDDGSEFQTSFNDSISINLNHNHDDRYDPLGAADAAAQKALTEAKNHTNEQIDLVTDYIDKQTKVIKTYTDESITELRNYTNEELDNTKKEIIADAPDKHNTLEKLGDLIEANERQVQELKENVAYDQEVSKTYETKFNVEQKISETKRYVDDALDSLEIPEVDLSNYYNKQEINDALENKADREEIPSLDEYATKKYVDEAIDGINIPEVDLSEYYKKDEVDEALREKANQSALDDLTESVDQLEEAFKNIDSFGTQADWEQNDETALDYVKNRTHWVEKGFTEIVNTTVNYDAYEEGYLVGFAGEKDPAVGDVYTVSINGDATQEFTLDDTLVFDYVCGTNGKTYTFNFSLGWTDVYIFAADGSSDSFDLVMNASGEIYHTIDAKFIPDDIHIRLKTAQTAADDALSIANIAKDTVDGKMDAENPVGTGTFSMSRAKNSDIGRQSFAAGYNVTASGIFSHAIGRTTIASGGTSYAEGRETIANGGVSHAEGRSTIANGDYSHVQGKFNIADDTNTYAHIVGNGDSDTARSNAHSLDWDGNAWFQGDVYVGSTSGINRDEGSVKLATIDDLNSSIVQATDEEIIEMLIQEDLVPVVTDADGSVLADENDNILLW